MKKIVAILCISISSVLFLSSCFGLVPIPFHVQKSDSYSEEKMKLLFDALKNEDREAVRKLFSEKALREADDFEERLDELFEYMKGDLVSCVMASSPGYGESVSRGKTVSVRLRHSYYIQTTEEKYYIDITDFYIDKIDPENEGFFVLFFVKAEDKDKIYDPDFEIMHSWVEDGEPDVIQVDKIYRVGICVPFFDEMDPPEITSESESL